jgi:hypothetical protein
MHLQRGVNTFIIVLVLCLGLFTTIVCADDTTNISNQTILVPPLTQNPVNLSVTTLITPTTISASVLPTETSGSTEGACSYGTPVSDGTCTGSSQEYPSMHFTPEQLKEIYSQMDKAPKISLMSQRVFTALPPQSKNLLPYLDYTPAERYQGSCGDCWQWASTGALEIDHAVKNNVKDRLSVQYFNSNYHNGAAGYSCCGGWLNHYTTWYNEDLVTRTPIPWSNTKANFGDSGTPCGSATAVPAGTIATTPHYNLTSMTDSLLDTYGVGQIIAIDTIKTEINANKPVWYGFYYNSSGMNDFKYNFWAPKNEDQIFNPDPWAYFSDTAEGHAVLIVGYNDTDDNPNNHYWLVLNSWGTRSGRPNGLFRLKMNMNYDATYQSGYRQQVFEILDANFISPAPTITGITPSSGLNSSPVSITNLAGTNFFGTPTVKLNRTGHSDITATGVTVVDPTNITCVLPISGSPAGQYNVVVINPDGQQAMLTNGFMVNGLPSAKIGIFRNGAWYLDYNGNGWWDGPVTDRLYPAFGTSGDQPVAGNWSGDGITEIGVFRNGAWYLDYNGNGWWDGPVTDRLYPAFGMSGDLPVAGDWNNDGITEIGVFRNGVWYLDYSGNGWWDGPVTDRKYPAFGTSGDKPVAGNWS